MFSIVKLIILEKASVDSKLTNYHLILMCYLYNLTQFKMSKTVYLERYFSYLMFIR